MTLLMKLSDKPEMFKENLNQISYDIGISRSHPSHLISLGYLTKLGVGYYKRNFTFKDVNQKMIDEILNMNRKYMRDFHEKRKKLQRQQRENSTINVVGQNSKDVQIEKILELVELADKYNVSNKVDFIRELLNK